MLPSTQLIVVRQAGHGPQYQHPDLVAKNISFSTYVESLMYKRRFNEDM